VTAAQLYSRGPLVELLVGSQVARYVEFKALEGMFVRVGAQWEQVPASKEGVFHTRLVSVVEKRSLMKFLTFCLSYQQQPDAWRGGATFTL
jgi:Rab proteins geranylgeranyltransferase component A